MEEAAEVNEPDFDKMTKREVVDWFTTTGNLSPMVASMHPATEQVSRPAAGVPMVLASIRLPVELVEQIDRLAEAEGLRRSEVIREALVAHIREQTAPVERDEAVRALDVLRRLVVGRAEGTRAA